MSAKDKIVWNSAPAATAVPDVKISPERKAEIKWDQARVLPDGTPAPTVSPVASQAYLTTGTPVADQQLAFIETNPILNADEKEWLKTNRDNLTPQQLNHAQVVMSGYHDRQQSFIAPKGGVKNYYFDQNGIPQPLGFAERPPDNIPVASAWGNAMSAKDDTGLTSLAKSVWNGFAGIIKTPAAITNWLYGAATGDSEDTDFYKGSKNLYEQLSFHLSPESNEQIVDEKAFTSVSEFFNSDNWTLNTDNIMSLTGQTIGTLLQFALGGRALGVTNRAQAIGLSTTLMLGDAMDEAGREGLTGRDKYAVALMSALGQGVLEVAIGGQELKLLGIGAKSGVMKEVSGEAVKAFRGAGGEITEASLKSAFEASLKTGAKVLPKIGAVAKNMGVEATEEITQAAWNNAMFKVNDEVMGTETGRELFDPRALKEYFINGLAGAIGGGVGGGMVQATGQSEEQQSKTIYAHLASGNELVLRNSLDHMVEKGQMTPEQAELASFRIDAYKRYASETKDLEMDDPTREQVFNLTWKDENIKKQMEDLEANETMTPAIKEARMKVLKDTSKMQVNEIAALIQGQHPRQRAEDEAKQELLKQQEEAAARQAELQMTAAKAEGEDDLNKIFAQADESGEMTPELMDVIAKRREEILIEPEVASKPVEVVSAEQQLTQAGRAPKETPDQRRKRIVEKFLQESPGHAHVKESDTNRLSGGEFISGQPKIARAKLKEGDVLTVVRNLPKPGEKLFFEGQAREEGYDFDLRAYKDDQHVGGIKYDGKDAVLINRLLDEGKEVKLVVTENMPYGGKGKVGRFHRIEYQVVTRDAGRIPQQVLNKPKQVTLSRAQRIKRINDQDPNTFEEAVLRFFLNKNTISEESFERNTGFRRGSKERRQAKGILSKRGMKTDLLNEVPELMTERFGMDQDTAERELYDVIASYPTKSAMLARVLELQEKADLYGAMSPYLPEGYVYDLEADLDKLAEEHANAQINTSEDADNYINETLGTYVDEQAEIFAGYFAQEVDRSESVAETQGRAQADQAAEKNAPQQADDDVDTFYGKPPRPEPVQLRAERSEIPQDADYMALLAEVETLDELDELGEVVAQRGKFDTAFTNAYIKKQQEISARDFGKAGGIKYQSETKPEPLASADPQFFQQVVDKLSAAYPSVTVFQDAEMFQEFLDKNFPGEKLDLTKIGAAIGNAVYIDPKRARQSTAVHEFAHIYWGMLPDNDPVKMQLLQMFGSEEAAVTAVGKIGTDAAKVKLQGDLLTKFLTAVRDFFAKVRRMITGKRYAGPEAAAKEAAAVFADRVWRNAERVEAIQENEPGPVKYMSDEASDKQRQVVEQLQNIATHFDFDPATHTYTLKGTHVKYPSVTRVLRADAKYSYDYTDKGPDAANRGTGVHLLAEAIARGADPKAAVEKFGLQITPEALESISAQISDLMDELRADGQLIPETVVASSSMKMAGTTDLPVVSPDGVVDIYDFKTSTRSTNVASYSKRYGKKGSKKDGHGVQLAMYGRMIESADSEFGTTGTKIGRLAVIPIKYSVKDGVITRAEIEPLIDIDYADYKDEADRVMGEHVLAMEAVGQKELADAEMLDEEEFLKTQQVSIKELRAQLTALRRKPLSARKDKEKELMSAIRRAEDASATYKRDFKKLQKIAKDGKWEGVKEGNIASVPREELVAMKNLINNYDDLRHNVYLRRLDYEIGERLKAEREGELGVGEQAEPDITKLDVLFKAPSDFTEKNPVIQGIIKKYFGARQSEERAINFVNEEADDLAMAVIKEKETNKDILKRGKRLLGTDRGMEKYFENLFVKTDGVPQLKNPQNPDQAKTLSKAELAFLSKITENMGEFRARQAQSEAGWSEGFYPQVAPKFWESYYNSGLVGAVTQKQLANANEALLDMQIEFVDPVTKGKTMMSYREAVEKINKYAKKNLIDQAVSVFKLKSAKRKAEAAYKAEGGTDGAGEYQKYSITSTGQMIGRFQRARESDAPVSLNVLRAYKEYMSDMLHIEHMQPILPEVTAVRSYYEQRKVNPNIEEFLKLWHEGDILGKQFTGRFGKGVDAFAKVMQGWTYMNVMTFNVKGGLVFNSAIGKLNQFRAEGGKSIARGEKRYWGNPKKAFAILRHYNVISSTLDDSTQNSFGTFWAKLSNAPVAMGEHWIQGAAFLGLLTEDEFSNFDDKGNLIDKSKRISNDRLTEMRKRVRDVQGKYGFEDKRMYKHYAVMAAAMGFKGWMPDMLKERFGEAYTDMFGKKHKGSYRSLPYIFRDFRAIMSDFARGTSTDADVINNKKNIREIVSLATLFAIYAMVNGDSPEEKKRGALVMRAIGDMATIWNLNSWEFLAGNPVPALGTMKNFVNALESLVFLQVYQRDGAYGDKGDYMFPGRVLSVLPYKNVVSVDKAALGEFWGAEDE